MSNVSNRHAVVPFIAGASKPLATQRLTKVGYKSSKDKVTKKTIPAKYKSVCASIPMIDPAAVEMFADQLIPHLVTLLETAQDGILKSVYESSAGQLTDITDEQLSIPACIAFLNAEAAGTRLSEDSIGAWFDSDCADNLSVIAAEKMKIDDIEDDRVIGTVKLHKQIVCMLAGKNVTLSEQQKTAIRNVIKYAADTDTGIGAKVSAKFDAMCAAPETVLQNIEAF